MSEVLWILHEGFDSVGGDFVGSHGWDVVRKRERLCVFDDVEQCLSVACAFDLSAMQDFSITTKLFEVMESFVGKPDDRMKPPDNLNHALDSAEKDIATFDVHEFVSNDSLEIFLRGGL